MRERAVEVLDPGPLATVQDLGRPGYAELAVGASGAADGRSLTLANRLVGNPEETAGIEATLGGLALRFHSPALVAVTGAPCDVWVGTGEAAQNATVHVPSGVALRLGIPHAGLRTYVAVRGGLDLPTVLGSRATDVISGLGPAALSSGDVLPIGQAKADVPAVDVAPVPPLPDPIVLRVMPGPRDDWFADDALPTLAGSTYTVTPASNRVGLRLHGPALRREVEGELASEGMVTGAIQVPPDGQPVLFLPDHPVTGGYPVVAVVVSADLPLAGQARPGQVLSFRLLARPW